MILSGRQFYKMSGSGNDFVFVDAREHPAEPLVASEAIRAICARGTGVGADGIVFLLPPLEAALRMRYLNSDGSLAALCGNATLCTARLGFELGVVGRDDFAIETDSGLVPARFIDGEPEIDLPAPDQLLDCFEAPLEGGERRMGFAVVGVPHLVVLCDDVDRADVMGRGRLLRRHPSLRDGANVNFVSRASSSTWRVRTYERGVEAETLACGTGAVATAVLLTAWGESTADVVLSTRSSRPLRVRLQNGLKSAASLSGEARIVFVGELREVPGLS